MGWVCSAEVQRRLEEIMKQTGKLRLDGVEYATAPGELEDLGELGFGSCGHVFKMRFPRTGHEIAVKRLLHRLEICIVPRNTNSRRVMEKLRFRNEGIAERFLEMPRDRLTLSIRVSRKVNFFGLLCQGFELVDHLALFIRNAVFRGEVIFNIHRDLRTQQVTHMPYGCPDGVTLAQKAPDCARFGWRFNDDELH